MFKKIFDFLIEDEDEIIYNAPDKVNQFLEKELDAALKEAQKNYNDALLSFDVADPDYFEIANAKLTVAQTQLEICYATKRKFLSTLK